MKVDLIFIRMSIIIIIKERKKKLTILTHFLLFADFPFLSNSLSTDDAGAHTNLIEFNEMKLEYEH